MRDTMRAGVCDAGRHHGNRSVCSIARASECNDTGQSRLGDEHDYESQDIKEETRRESRAQYLIEDLFEVNARLMVPAERLKGRGD